MDDPHDAIASFNLQAHPEVCVGTSESIESVGRRSIVEGRLRLESQAVSKVPSIRLTPEPAPPGTPAGWRAFRFTHSERVYLGTVCGVISDPDTEYTVFVMGKVGAAHDGSPSLVMRQNSSNPIESHILVPPNGFVSPQLIVVVR